MRGRLTEKLNLGTAQSPAEVLRDQVLLELEDIAPAGRPFWAKDRQAGYRYQLSALQIELSLPHVLACPVSGRIFFEK
jgi:hypothetical protein